MADGGAHRAALGRHPRRFAALTRALRPSDGRSDELVAATVDEVAALMGVIAPVTQKALRGSAMALEQGTRELRLGQAFLVAGRARVPVGWFALERLAAVRGFESNPSDAAPVGS